MEYMEFIRELALSFPETTEEMHFNKISFRVKKKIFATFDEKSNLVCLKFSETDQDVFSSIGKTAIYPVPNKWGKQGWTFLQPGKVRKEILIDALTTAYCEVAPKKLVRLIRPRKKVEKK